MCFFTGARVVRGGGWLYQYVSCFTFCGVLVNKGLLLPLAE